MNKRDKVYYPEFFNDVFGPVMQPGSSSHTAGPCRIGYIANSLLEGKLKNINIVLDPNGSFAGTFGHMNEDLGMLAGAYGFMPDDDRLFDIKDILHDEKIPWNIDFKPISESSHPNAVRFELTDINGCRVTLTGNSTGGGRIETVEIDGHPFVYNGERKVTVSFDDSHGRKEYSFPCILTVSLENQMGDQLFRSFEEWIQYSEKNNVTLSEAAYEYEKRASGWSKQKITEYMKLLKSYMDRQTLAPYEDENSLLETPYSGYHFRSFREYEEQSSLVVGPVIAKALRYMFGVQALTKKTRMVPGPMGTGGGFQYSCFKALAEEKNYSEQQVIDAMMVAAGVGAICYTRTDPTGEITGCAGECGVCGAMAAAGLTYMQEGNPYQVEAAASMALQMALGWPCDPIPGGSNQPCISRVSTVVTMAFVFSQLALSGQSAVIPFHEVVDVMDRMGREMPSKYKCTSCGGMCEAPTAQKCKSDFTKWHNETK